MLGIAQTLREKGIEVIKLDTAKMTDPMEWGWRFVAFDLRMPNGQLVEFYAPLREFDSKEIKGPNHKLFEKWRNRSQKEIFESPALTQQFEADVNESYERYSGAYRQAISRMGYRDEAAAAASWTKLVARLSSAQGEKSSLSSSAVGTADSSNVQSPSGDLRPNLPSGVAEGQTITEPSEASETGNLFTPSLTQPGEFGQPESLFSQDTLDLFADYAATLPAAASASTPFPAAPASKSTTLAAHPASHVPAAP